MSETYGLDGGKYAPELKAALETTKANSVLLVVLKGDRGNGMSVAGPVDVIRDMPRLLRTVADSLEEMYNKAAQS